MSNIQWQKFVALVFKHRHYATSRKIEVSSPDEVFAFFSNLPNPSSLTMALGFTQPLTEKNTIRYFWG
jgi:hypothetical protein